MNRNIVGRIVAGLVLAAILVGVGLWAYNAGYDNGLVQAGALGENAREIPYRAFYGHPMGFGLGSLLIGLFVFFLAFGALRRLIWGPRMWHRWGYRRCGEQPGQPGDPQRSVPPFFDEWHRQAHADEEKKS